MKKLIFGLFPFASAGMAFAEGAASGTVTIPADATKVADAVVTWAQALAPTVLTIVGAFLGFWAIKVGLRVIKGIASSSK